MHSRMFSSIPDHLLDANSTLSNSNNQKYLQALPNVPWWGKMVPRFRTTGSEPSCVGVNHYRMMVLLTSWGVWDPKIS